MTLFIAGVPGGKHVFMHTRVAAGVSLVLSLILLGLAHLLVTIMRPSLVRPLVYFVSSASVLLLFFVLSREHANRFVRSAAGLALAVESVHLTVALALLAGVIPPLGGAADANWLLARGLLVLILIAIRVSDGRGNRASVRITTSVAAAIACFAVFPTPALFHLRAIALIVFYGGLLADEREPAITLTSHRTAGSLAMGMGAAFLLVAGAASAWMSIRAYYQPPERVWAMRPRVIVSATRSDDPRIAHVVDAVGYWNGQLQRMGSPFRLEAVSVTGRLTENDRKALTLERVSADTQAKLAGIGPSMVIVLHDEPIVSFVHHGRVSGSVVVVISEATGLLARPNVLPNIVAHEMGHAIGLRHNDVPESLMCGRPAPCGVERFESAHGRLFPLAAQDEDALRRWYP